MDERLHSETIGALLFSGKGKSGVQSAKLKSGTFEEVKRLLINGIPRDTALMPLRIRIKEYAVKETISAGNRVAGEVNVLFGFDIEKVGGQVPLTEYKTTARYTRFADNLNIVESTLQNLLANSLHFINNWVNKEASSNPKLAKGIKLSFRDYQEQHEDTVYYSPSRPLLWDDFREKRSDSRFAASVFPSFGYEQRTRMADGIIDVQLMLKVFVVKSASWVGPGTQSTYNLQHEQKHFDLVKLVAERFKKKLLSEKLTPDNYEGIINFEYIEFYREMNRVQKEYDEQTAHGTTAAVQELWNRKINSELAQIDN